jgi:TonB family protein
VAACGVVEGNGIMKRMAATIALSALLAAGSAAFAQAPATAPAPPAAPLTPEAQAVADAKPNVAKVKTRPKWLSGPAVDLPEAEKALGHHGKVVVTGVLGVDGKIRYATVTQSSGAPNLDALALEATLASVFEPAKDAEGAVLAIPISIPTEFYNYKSDKPGGGMVRYRCDQFVKDMDWWRATFPDARWSRLELYTMMLGLGTLARLNAGALNAENLQAANADFERRFVKSIEDCRARPEKRFVDMLQPEGAMAEALSKSAR